MLLLVIVEVVLLFILLLVIVEVVLLFILLMIMILVQLSYLKFLGPTLLNKIARWSHHQSSNSAWKEGPHHPVGKGHLRSGYVKIAIENGPFSSLIYPLQ